MGAYSVLVFMTQRLLWPLTRLGETFDLYQRAMASSTRVLDVLASPIELKQGTFQPSDDEEKTSSISLEHLDFAYPDRAPLFQDLSLTFEHGKTTGVVGSTGAGKTSLIRLLLRFAEPQSGHVSWCGQPLDEWDLHALRSSIALVDQHITLFPTSIMENIRYMVGPRQAMKTLSKQLKSPKPLRLWPTYQKDGKPWSVKVGIVCLEDSGNALPLPEPFSRMRRSSCWTKRPQPSTTKPRPHCNAPSSESPRPHDDCDRPQALNGTSRRPNPCAGRRKGR